MDDLTDKNFKRSGFAGERSVVLPGSVADFAARHPLLRGLRVTDAGFYPRAARHGVHRAHGARGAVLIVCREGAGWLRFGTGAKRPIGPGDVALLAPRREHAYGASSDDPWTIQWTHFEGTELSEWWRLLGLAAEGGILRLCAGWPETLDLGRVHEQLGCDIHKLLAAAAALRWALAHLRFGAARGAAGDSARRAVEEVEAWMREHHGATTTLARLARRAALSPSHFSALFRERFGCAPMHYLIQLKIQRACHLLDGTVWPVARIAEEVGLTDPLYFSRRFRAMVGLSPRAYRSRTKP